MHRIHHPIAPAPSDEGPDREVCASGQAIDNDGVAIIIYAWWPTSTCIATSTDDELIEWNKLPELAIPSPKNGETVYGKYRDGAPCMWREGDYWYDLCGRREPDGGDMLSFSNEKTC